MTIKIRQKLDGRWSLKFSPAPTKESTAKRFKKATSIISFLGNLPQKYLIQKPSVKVFYPDGGHNETVNSIDLDYLVYTTTCFLEDYLDRRYLFNKIANSHGLPTDDSLQNTSLKYLSPTSGEEKRLSD